jgi:hypothetical protein
MIDYQQGFIKTPGGRTVLVNVINPKHPVRQAGHTFTVPLIDESGIRVVGECAKERVDNRRDCMILWTGDRGAGKSTGITKVARFIDPGFDVPQIAFHLEEFSKLFCTNPQGDGEKGIYPQVVMDEAGYALYGMQWLQREQMIIAKQMIINRIMRQIVHAAVPKRKQFNNQVRDMAFIWVHVSEPQEYLQGYAVVRMAPAHLQSEFHSEKYWEPKLAFTFTEEKGDFWDRYETKKIAFVKEVTEENAKGKAKGGKFADARDAVMKAYYEYRRAKGEPLTYESLGEIVGLRKSQVASIVKNE